jgi:hypothetical protein
MASEFHHGREWSARQISRPVIASKAKQSMAEGAALSLDCFVVMGVFRPGVYS